MKLRDKIVVQALELFNKQGIANVSPNQIAASLEISTGNLTYHFKTKAVLIEAIYMLMEERFIASLGFEGYITLDHFRQKMIRINQYQEDFRFFFHDIVFIRRNYPKIAKRYNDISYRSVTEGRELIDYYIATERLIPEENGIDYDYLIQSIWMMGIFWHTHKVIIQRARPLKYATNLVDLSWYTILPYLTEKGKAEYDQINQMIASTSSN